MLSSITKVLTKYTAKITLAGTRTVRRTTKRTQDQRDAEREAAAAEKEWWEGILRQDAEDQRREFHECNADWAMEVQKYEEEVMQKQDQELKELKENEEQAMKDIAKMKELEQKHKQERIKAMREQAYLLLTEKSGFEDLEDSEDSESYAPSVGSFRPPPSTVQPESGPPCCTPLRSVLSETPPPMLLVCSDVPAALARMAANDFILETQLERQVHVPWWADYVGV